MQGHDQLKPRIKLLGRFPCFQLSNPTVLSSHLAKQVDKNCFLINDYALKQTPTGWISP